MAYQEKKNSVKSTKANNPAVQTVTKCATEGNAVRPGTLLTIYRKRALWQLMFVPIRSACCNDYGHVCDSGRDCCLTGCCGYSKKCCSGTCCDDGNLCCPDANGGKGGCCFPGQTCCGNTCCDSESQYCSSGGTCLNRVTSTKAQVTVTVTPVSASTSRGCDSIALIAVSLGVIWIGLQ